MLTEWSDRWFENEIPLSNRSIKIDMRRVETYNKPPVAG
jgi:hypothetical protein